MNNDLSPKALHTLAIEVANAFDGWHYDTSRGRGRDAELYPVAYLRRADGGCSVYLRFIQWGAREGRLELSSGAEWRDSEGKWCPPYDREPIEATSAPDVRRIIQAIRRIESRAEADCAAAAKMRGEHAEYLAREAQIREALISAGCSTWGKDGLTARNDAADARLDLRVSGGSVRVDGGYMTPEQVTALVRFILSDSFPTKGGE